MVYLGLSWFELPNLEIDSIKRTIKELQGDHTYNALKGLKSNAQLFHISKISLEKLREEGQNKEMSVFVMTTSPSSISHNSRDIIPNKYRYFIDVFDA